jgi:hypothetical protein
MHEGLTPNVAIADLVVRELSDKEVRDMWYDWFCRDTSLVRKGRTLLARIRAIGDKSPRFDAKKHYAFFKNNCPGEGSLYDDFRICDRETGDVVFCVIPAEGYTRTRGEACVWGKHPTTGEFGELVRGAWSDVKAFFKERDEAKVLQMIADTERFNMIRQAERENVRFAHDKRTAEYDAKWCARNADQEYADQFVVFVER